ncbi:hypothetical protein ANN_14421 [Periplaneta americana]|uniref:Uncharacterized protein n=1 Tax=Periplaneta americana TaxID=6978 RepID=A0ABQ8SWA6_PERAM|nr:hypothetical protein ANN_14421 [Periplaneta americana]
MAGLYEGGSEPPGSLNAINKEISIQRERESVRGKNTLDMEEAASIPKVKSIHRSDNIYGSLAFLKAHFSDLPKYIEYLESLSLQLKDAIGVIDSLLQKQVPGPVGEADTLKLKEVLQRKPGFEKMSAPFSRRKASIVSYRGYLLKWE